MKRDPFGPWTAGRKLFWAIAALVILPIESISFIPSLWPPRTFILDFFQEWSSVRNWRMGLPVYTDLELAAERHLGMRRDAKVPWGVNVNAHPPTSVLMVLPLAWLDYPAAFFVWNLISLAAMGASLWLIMRQLEIEISRWTVIAVVTLLSMCNPFRQQINQGQWNLVLLLVLIAMWAADRNGRPALAGWLLGLAVTVKVFPAVLAVYFAARRRWRVLAWAAVSTVALSGATAAVLGIDAFRGYIVDVLPCVTGFRDWWANLSLIGFWCRLFDAQSGHVEPLRQMPILARVGSMISVAVVMFVVARRAWQARSQEEFDFAFALALIAMLLVSPIAWDHYFLLLALPVLLMSVRSELASRARWLFVAVLAVTWLNPKSIWDVVIPGAGEMLGGVARPIHSVSVLAYQTVATLAFFILTFRVRDRVRFDRERAKGASDSADSSAALAEPALANCDTARS